MEEVVVSKDTFDKLVNVVANMPYAQVAQLLAEVSSNSRMLEEDIKDDSGD